MWEAGAGASCRALPAVTAQSRIMLTVHCFVGYQDYPHADLDSPSRCRLDLADSGLSRGPSPMARLQRMGRPAALGVCSSWDGASVRRSVAAAQLPAHPAPRHNRTTSVVAASVATEAILAGSVTGFVVGNSSQTWQKEAGQPCTSATAPCDTAAPHELDGRNPETVRVEADGHSLGRLRYSGALVMHTKAYPLKNEIEPLDSDGDSDDADSDVMAAAAPHSEPASFPAGTACITPHQRAKRTVSRMGLRAAASAAWRKERGRAASVRELLGWRQRPPAGATSSRAAGVQQEEPHNDVVTESELHLPAATAVCLTQRLPDMQSIGEPAPARMQCCILSRA